MPAAGGAAAEIQRAERHAQVAGADTGGIGSGIAVIEVPAALQLLQQLQELCILRLNLHGPLGIFQGGKSGCSEYCAFPGRKNETERAD